MTDIQLPTDLLADVEVKVSVRERVTNLLNRVRAKIRKVYRTFMDMMTMIKLRLRAAVYTFIDKHPKAWARLVFVGTWAALAIGLALWMAFYMTLFIIFWLLALTLVGALV